MRKQIHISFSFVWGGGIKQIHISRNPKGEYMLVLLLNANAIANCFLNCSMHEIQVNLARVIY